MDFSMILLLLAVGIFAAAYGSLVGSGGGFIVVPALTLLLPDAPPALLAATSLTGVLFAGLSGTLAYGRLRLIDYRSGLAFAGAMVPGALLGSLLVRALDLAQFRLLLGILLILVGGYLVLAAYRKVVTSGTRGGSHRRLVDRRGTAYEYRFSLPLGIAFSFVEGFVAALFGIGGGSLFTPFAIAVLGFPVLIAAATSVFTMNFISATAILTHLATGTIGGHTLTLLTVAFGMAVGGQVGPRIARRVGHRWVVPLLAGALVLVGVSMVVLSLQQAPG